MRHIEQRKWLLGRSSEEIAERLAQLEAENLRLVAALKLSRQYVKKCTADDMPIRISIRAAGVLRAIDNVLDSGSRQ